jgi:hypothetical protein
VLAWAGPHVSAGGQVAAELDDVPAGSLYRDIAACTRHRGRTARSAAARELSNPAPAAGLTTGVATRMIHLGRKMGVRCASGDALRRRLLSDGQPSPELVQ